eukprot:gene6722-354_t
MTTKTSLIYTWMVVALLQFALADRLNDHVANFEIVVIHSSQTMYKGRYTRENYLHQEPFTFSIKAFNQSFRFDLSTHTDIFTPNFKISVSDGKQSTPYTIDDRQYYFGLVNHNVSEFCHFRVGLDGSIRGFFTHNGEKYAVDPSILYFKHARVNDHVVYRLSDHDANPFPNTQTACKAHLTQLDPSDVETPARHRRSSFNPAKTVCDVVIVVDSKFFSSVANSDISQAIDIAVQRFADVKRVFEEENTVTDESTSHAIGLAIAFLEIQSDSGNDPYNTNQNFNEDGEKFLRHLSTNPSGEVDWDEHCLVHVLTNQEFSGGLLGLAWVGSPDSTPGGLCENRRKISGKNMNTNSGFSTQTNFGRRVPSLTAYLVFAHELGHNFGAGHDDDEQPSNQGQFLMWPVSVDGSRANNYLFSDDRLTEMGKVITAKGGCFISSSEPRCGNGVQEGDEACDCGSQEDLCEKIDKCCQIGCKLAESAECRYKDLSHIALKQALAMLTTCGIAYVYSPRHSVNGTCCGDDCKPLDEGHECRAEGACTKASNCTSEGACPIPEKFTDNTVCGGEAVLCNDGVCSRSICHLWDLDEAFPTGEDACLVYCDNDGDMTEPKDLGEPNVMALNKDGTNFTIPEETIFRPVGSICHRDDSFEGICDDQGSCESSRGRFIFNDIEDFLKNLTFDDLKEWATRTDAYIPNWAWLVIGFVLLCLLIAGCCALSNRMDKAKGVS